MYTHMLIHYYILWSRIASTFNDFTPVLCVGNSNFTVETKKVRPSMTWLGLRWWNSLNLISQSEKQIHNSRAPWINIRGEQNVERD